MSDPVFAPFWNESGEGQDQWDQLILAGNTWPGLADVSGSGVKRRIDVKKTKGKDGAVLKDNGMDPAKLKINLRIWTAEQWSRFNELLPLIHPKRKGGSREPTEIIHPQANLLGIKAILAESYERIHRSNLVGMGVLPLQFKEGKGVKSLGITGREVFDIKGLEGTLSPRQDIEVSAKCEDGSSFKFQTTARLDSQVDIDYYRNGGILHTVLRGLIS